MSSSSLHRHLTAARPAMSGELTSTSRVVDVLLDLRPLLADRPGGTALVDSSLSNIRFAEGDGASEGRTSSPSTTAARSAMMGDPVAPGREVPVRWRSIS